MPILRCYCLSTVDTAQALSQGLSTETPVHFSMNYTRLFSFEELISRFYPTTRFIGMGLDSNFKGQQ